MRIDLAERSLSVAPGRTAELEVDVYNTAAVIDGVTARAVGLDPDWVTTQPRQLALFPDSSGRLLMRIALPTEYPAGTHRVTVEVASSVATGPPEYVDVDLVVSPLTEATLRVDPPISSGHRKGKFEVNCHNDGNTAIELALHASDPERALQYSFEPAAVIVPPGGSATSEVRVKGRRHLFGNELTRAITVVGMSEDLEVEAQSTYHQKANVPRGVLTALILMAVVALWAGAFLLGLSKVLSHDKLTKTAPPSFFAAATAAAASAANGAAAGGAAPPPAGAVSKSGAAGAIGGTVSGTVSAKSTGLGVGRITVEAIRDTKSGPKLVSSAASQTDGTYTLEGLFPGSYKLRFTSHGFKDVWYPSATDSTGAQSVSVAASSATKSIDATVEGLPGSIIGKVDTGQTDTPVPVTVSVRPVEGSGTAVPVGQTVTDPQGNFVVPNLATPASYELSFSATGYQQGTDVEQLGGGETRTANTVRMSAGAGAISGHVTDGKNPLGGVIVTTTVGGQTITSATPTTGSIGQFALTGLPTPGTYLVTFAKQGFGAQTIAVALGPGETRTDLALSLVGGTGTVKGKVVDVKGNGLGGVTVTVGGGPTSAATKTLTAGSVGSFLISGLPTPGTYTMTFSLAGYGSQTLPVVLSSNGLADDVNATLTAGVARLTGTVLDSLNNGIAGATITVTDGSITRTATSTSTPAGGYTVTDLQPGSYSVTFSAAGFVSKTALIIIQAAQDTTQVIALDAVP